MPVIHDIPVTLDTGELLRHQGMAGCSRPRAEITTLMHEVLESIREQQVLKPAIIYESCEITGIFQDRICLKDDLALHGWLLPARFSLARKITVIVCTIGPKLEQAAAEYFRKGEPLRGLLLDGVGNAAIDSVVREACRLVRDEASSYDYQISSPISPGAPGFPVSEQYSLFKLLPAGQVNVRLTKSGVMLPRKSISMLVGMGTDMPARVEDKMCDSCNMVRSCMYRLGSSSFSPCN